MRLKNPRLPVQRRAAVLAFTLVAGAVLATAGGQAQPATGSPASKDVAIAAGLSGPDATALAGRLGRSRTGGVYLDPTSGRMVVTVTDAEAAKVVTDAGAAAKLVTYSTTQLDAIAGGLDDVTPIPNTAYGVDVVNNEVLVQVGGTVGEAELANLRAVTEPHGRAARVERVGGTMELGMSGGETIRSRTGRRCTAGFNVRSKTNPNSLFLVTAGHCTQGTGDWLDHGSTYFGYKVGARYPTYDYGLIRHYSASVPKPGNVWVPGGLQDITHSRDSHAQERVCVNGSTSGYTCGPVQVKHWTVVYSNGDKVKDLDFVSVCRDHGDSGGPMFHGNAALGLMSGFNTSNCQAYYQPINPALAWYGVEVY
ncbi:alpha-lytic protease prodomain-containing protein [Streptomyces sp. SID13031]|uniref:alpha-lytic protease prodomain-containing protein n=1 Tax=Streptomyces sp. SID13031 TaxID=2706046 RepID=UPI0013CBAD47|nr:alpha-lytic protease prodomain-containing protein [Streptomyces sp. SID13031]NEA35028.1 S1 family peptidase [Streptomyces sp. SID13031]